MRHYPLSHGEVGGCAAAASAYGLVLWWLSCPLPTVLVSVILMLGALLVTLIDMRHFQVPDVLSLPAIPLGLGAAVLARPGPWQDIVADHGASACLAGGCLYVLRWAYWRRRGVIGLGLGDVKLGAVAGAWLGLAALPPALLLASVSALAAVGLRMAMSGRGAIDNTTRIPFGSFIAPAIVIVWTAGILGF